MTDEEKSKVCEQIGVIGVDHVELCVHKIIHFRSTGEKLLCNECPRTQCRFYGCHI